MSSYPFFIPEFVLCTNSSLFWFKIANELREFRNYLRIYSAKFITLVFFLNLNFRKFANTFTVTNGPSLIPCKIYKYFILHKYVNEKCLY